MLYAHLLRSTRQHEEIIPSTPGPQAIPGAPEVLDGNARQCSRKRLPAANASADAAAAPSDAATSATTATAPPATATAAAAEPSDPASCTRSIPAAARARADDQQGVPIQEGDEEIHKGSQPCRSLRGYRIL